MQETWVQSLGGEGPLEKGMATHSSILAWRIPWIEKPDGLQIVHWSHKDLDTTEQLTLSLSETIRVVDLPEPITLFPFKVRKEVPMACPS